MKATAALALALLLCGPAARASVIEPLSPVELFAGADAVVEGRVLSVETRWNASGTGVETRVDFAVARRLQGMTPDVVTLVQPGGQVREGRHVVVGMPSWVEGEEARLFLRRLPEPSGAHRYRVYGWQQGKWTKTANDDVARFVPDSARPEGVAGVHGFATNGMRWPPQKIPVGYKVHSAGSDDIALDDVELAVAAGFATWQEVPCASLAFEYAGETSLGVAVDQENVILFLESGWLYGEEAAGATSLWIPVEGEQTADIALNGQHFAWAVGPASAAGTTTMDLQGVLTHEMGHFSGLGHTQRAYDTMYYSWKPWPGQRTLSVDDKLGLCSLYPVPGDECVTSEDCSAGESCEPYDLGTLCAGQPAPVGTACSYAEVECDAFCLFTATDLSTGYCSRFCESDSDCPSTHRCASASAGGSEVRVCFARPPADGGAIPDDAGPSPIDAGTLDAGGCRCAPGSYCDEASGRCTFDCRDDADCGVDRSCDEDGRCLAEAPPGGCGCASARSTPVEGLLALFLLGATPWLACARFSRSRRGTSQPSAGRSPRRARSRSCAA